MNVWENVAFGLKVRHMPKPEIAAKVTEVLELVRLDGQAKRYPSQLSGGQRQRMALARALVVEPRVLLLDEPFGALDALVSKELRAWLRRLHDEVHVTTVLVTHDQEEAMEVADHLAVINHGRLEQVGTPSQLYERPMTRFVAEFIGESNIFAGIADTNADGFSIVISAGVRLRAVATRPLPANAHVVVSVRPERITLQAGDPPAEAENAIGGCVVEVIYLGRSRKYVIRTAAGPNVVSYQQARSGSEPGFDLGAAVSLRWRAEDATVLPDKAPN
jgi:ABC-type Fe3+/spermidine/putrescine transport system ATPase subunit